MMRFPNQPIDAVPVFVVHDKRNNAKLVTQRSKSRSTILTKHQGRHGTTTTTNRGHQTVSFRAISLMGMCLVVVLFVLSCVPMDDQQYHDSPPGDHLFRMASSASRHNDSQIPLMSTTTSLVRDREESIHDPTMSPPSRRPNDGSDKQAPKSSAHIGPLLTDGYFEITFFDKQGECRIAKLPRNGKFLKVDDDDDDGNTCGNRPSSKRLSINDILAQGRPKQKLPTKLALPKDLESYPCPPASATRHY